MAAARRGKVLFNTKAQCSSCHVAPLFTEPGWNLHLPKEICTDAFQARRAPTNRYRTTPLAGLWTHQKGGFYHDGRFPTLGAVVRHYNRCMDLGLSRPQQNDLVQYLLGIGRVK
jgi:cytochrome c peroxidase